jgi:hypothetical protein
LDAWKKQIRIASNVCPAIRQIPHLARETAIRPMFVPVKIRYRLGRRNTGQIETALRR